MITLITDMPLTVDELNALRARIADGDPDPYSELGGDTEFAARRLLATVVNGGPDSKADPVSWVWFMLGQIAAVVLGEKWAKQTGVAGGIVKHAVMAASQVAYLDK